MAAAKTTPPTKLMGIRQTVTAASTMSMGTATAVSSPSTPAAAGALTTAAPTRAVCSGQNRITSSASSPSPMDIRTVLSRLRYSSNSGASPAKRLGNWKPLRGSGLVTPKPWLSPPNT